MVTIADRIKTKETRIHDLQHSIQNLEHKFKELSELLKVKKTPESITSEHISNLKLYNELRDTGLRLAQMVADEKQCKLKEVFDEMGYEMKD